MDKKQSYIATIRASENVTWKIGDALAENTQLSFDQPYLPFIVNDSTWDLTPEQRLDLNHIVSNSYINLFAFVEEYIIALAVGISAEAVYGDPDRLRALLRFSEEEIKHQTLFHNFCGLFSRSFKIKTKILEESRQVADVVLNNSLAAVLLITLHLELITQEHYLMMKAKEGTLDPLFMRLLKLHWMEEIQHAKIDELELQGESETLDSTAKLGVIKSYLDVLEAFKGLLLKQAGFDLDGLYSLYPKLKQTKKHMLVTRINDIYQGLFIASGLKNKRMGAFVKGYFPEGLSLFLSAKEKNTETIQKVNS